MLTRREWWTALGAATAYVIAAGLAWTAVAAVWFLVVPRLLAIL